MQEDIGQVLTGFVMSKSNEEKEVNEEKIRALKEANPRDFLFAMIEQLNNETLATPARHLTGILFKNTAKGGDDGPLWFTLSDDDRAKLKEYILIPLADEYEEVRRSACS
mmetsp:Transcript_39657/g.39238  ORF Transcript_39657/g.39238 Transcript_39657/m.39238 type:complete len:110 (-) Transcript_39657:2272-2601(-)